VLAPSIELVRLMGIDAIVKTRQTQALSEERAEFFQDEAPGRSFDQTSLIAPNLLLYCFSVSPVIIRSQRQLQRSGLQEALSTEISQKRTAVL
jgi:hypothetical protein